MSLKQSELEALIERETCAVLMPGLYVVATDIGNPADITVRALAILQSVDFIICEERKVGAAFLKRYGIKKPLELLNEHNEGEQSDRLLTRLLNEKARAALISDCGTPLFADPGNRLVQLCQKKNIPVIPLPGASSLMAALMAAGRRDEGFLYYGFLPAGKLERIQALKEIKDNTAIDIIFLEAPYRLKPFLRDLNMVLGTQREGVIAYRLTQPEERMSFGNLRQLQKEAETLPRGEFVFILLAQKD